MAQEFENKAKEAFFDDDFSLAVDLYSQAIDLDPNNPNLFADRAQAYIKLNSFTEAVSDANKAILLNPTLSKAYLRKGTACFNLEEYHTAKVALEKGASFAPNDSRFTNLIQQCQRHIDAEESDSLAGILPPNGTKTSVPPVAADTHMCDKSDETSKEPQRDVPASQTNEVAPAPLRPKYRHEYYQKPDEVAVTIFAKGIPAENVDVEFGEQILSVTINVPGQDAYQYQPRLFGKIIPGKSKVVVLSTKIEIRLAKAEAINWTSLEYSKDVVPQKINVPTIQSERPAYPSSKSRAKDWDKLEAEVKKEEKEEKLDGDAALNKLFRDIYQSADEDMRRAMSKSFQESNGTVLSTDWKEVGSKKVEGSPPEGMEVKKWEY